jgi:hypothetical protein
MKSIDLATFLNIWDSTDGDTIVYIPLSSVSEKGRSLFVESFNNKKESDHLIARAFLTVEEAEAYVKLKKGQSIGLAKLKLERLYISFERFFGKKEYSKTFECVLSSLSVDGEFTELDILWTNKLDG